MERLYSISSEEVGLPYGLALTAFGAEAVRSVLQQPRWAKLYSSLQSKAQPTDGPTTFGIRLPGELIFEIAGRGECLYGFYADPDGVRLYAAARKRDWTPAAEVLGGKSITAQEALLAYGAVSLFTAVDKGSGLRGET
jgi:hypothetical protein